MGPIQLQNFAVSSLTRDANSPRDARDEFTRRVGVMASATDGFFNFRVMMMSYRFVIVHIGSFFFVCHIMLIEIENIT